MIRSRVVPAREVTHADLCEPHQLHRPGDPERQGIYIVENANLKDVGGARVHVFLLVLTPLKIQGATGSPLRALAVAPRP